MKPITLSVDEVDIFEGDEYDVVKYNLPITDQLQEYRDLFMQFPNTQSFPDFKPHMTIAYVKPGTGKKYKRKLSEPFDVTFTKGVYSYHDNPEDPEDFSRKEVDLEKEYKNPDKIRGGKIISESLDFERKKDPKEAMKIGSHRELSGQHLIDAIFQNIYYELREDPIFKEKDHIIFHDDVYNWIVAMVEDFDTGEMQTMSPKEITADMYREFYEDISGSEIEETDWDDILPSDWGRKNNYENEISES